MTTHTSIFRRWLFLPIAFICAHSACIVLIAVAIATSRDGEAEMGWYLPYCLDYPASLLAQAFGPVSIWEITVALLIVGAVWWGLIGTIIQSIWRAFMRS
jgi:hypothetical protein